MQLLQSNRCYEGEQRTYQIQSDALTGSAKFSIFLPAAALAGQPCAALFYLAGLTCNEETFAMKAHAQRMAAQLDLILICPDTSPRGEDVAAADSWDLGIGAGFYLNATQMPWATHYQMQDYIVKELYPTVLEHFSVSKGQIGIMGHSMGGHGALCLAFKFPEQFHSVSAFAPICAASQCPWGEKAFSHYLGAERTDWLAYDAMALLQQRGALFNDILIDQGLSDQFYSQLNPELLRQACLAVGQKLSLRQHEGYDHGYYFIQSFIDDHLQFHATQLKQSSR